MDTEEWRPVVGFEGRYEASSHGRVRSLGFCSGNQWGTKTWRAGRVLKPFPNGPSGHLAVSLSDGSTTRIIRVHRLVLRAFRGEPTPEAPNGLHADDNPTNNHLSNLRWGTRSDNAYDSVDNGSHVQARKLTCALDHLLVAPNLVESTVAVGARACLACKLSQANALHDARLREQGRERTRYNRTRDGFQRRRGESWQNEAHRRYAHIMRNHDGLA